MWLVFLKLLDYDTSDDEDNLKIAGCNLIRADYPSNTERGGVCIYYKHSFAFTAWRSMWISKDHSDVKYINVYNYHPHLVNRLTLLKIFRITSNLI